MSAAPKTYTQKFTVYRHDGDHLGNAKPGALLRYAQQIATTHAEAAGLTDEVYTATRTAFVLAKLALHIDRTPRVDEELTLVTQPECCKRAVNKRITHFYDADGAEVAVIDSRWVLIDIDKRIILRKHPEQFADHWAEDVPFALPMKMTKAAPEACELAGEPVASYSRCDMNGHLNNTRYADILCDALPWSVWEQGTVQGWGPASVPVPRLSSPREGPPCYAYTLSRARTGEKQYYFNGEREGKSAFEASITFA